MNTYEQKLIEAHCFACNELQRSGTAKACPSCGHFTFIDTGYDGSEADFDIAQQDDSFSYHLSALEDDIPQEYGGQEYY